MELPELTEQALFEAYLQAKCAVIGEFSGEITTDGLRLRKWAWRYAESRRLQCPVDLEPFGIYLSLSDLMDDDRFEEWSKEGLLP